ncbi:hypothetical protein COOONC_00113 [Cooperia oncophora]
MVIAVLSPGTILEKVKFPVHRYWISSRPVCASHWDQYNRNCVQADIGINLNDSTYICHVSHTLLLCSFILYNPTQAMVKLDRNAVLEYATFKVPYEELNMEFRRGHKNMERAGVGLKRSLSSLRNILSEKDGCISVTAAREYFRDFKSKLELLDSAKKDAVKKQRQFIKNMQFRIQFLRNEVSAVSVLRSA